MTLRPAAAWAFVVQVAEAWLDDHAASMGAALAYYTLFSLAPLLLIVISVAGLAFGDAAARGAVQGQLAALMGEPGASAVQALLASVRQPSQGWAAATLGAVLLFFGASSVFGELQDALDRIWRVPARVRADAGTGTVKGGRGDGWIALVRARLLSFSMILALGLLLIASLVASTVLAALGRGLDPIFGAWRGFAEAGNAALGFGLVALIVALIYKLMPRVQVLWADVWIGALFTALLFTLGKGLIGLYIGHSGIASGFGAAGSLVVVLLWVYFSAQILLIGAEFTWVFANTYGSRKGAAVGAAV